MGVLGQGRPMFSWRDELHPLYYQWHVRLEFKEYHRWFSHDGHFAEVAEGFGDALDPRPVVPARTRQFFLLLLAYENGYRHHSRNLPSAFAQGHKHPSRQVVECQIVQ